MELADQNVPQREIRVSILEDQSLVRDSLADFLEACGIQVAGKYADPEQFLARLDADRPKVAIIDLLLENSHGVSARDGLSVMRQMRQFYPDVHALIVSGSRQTDVVDQCYREGAAGYLDKLTAAPQQVVLAIEAVARGERYFPVSAASPTTPPSRAEQAANALLRSLSAREREVLAYISAGADNLKIATHLGITERTVKAHVSSLYRKLGPENRTQLALLARRLGVFPPENV